MPVLPLVGSTIVVLPGVIAPAASASSIIALAIRSFTEPPGFQCSHLAHTSAAPSPGRLRSWTSAVPPTRSRIFAVTRSGLSVTLFRLRAAHPALAVVADHAD